MIDRVVGQLLGWGSALVLPVSMLLFLQWPLRDLIHGYSREANDLAQLLFALYIALAVTFASRNHAHLAADAFARRYRAGTRNGLRRVAALLVLVPWSVFILHVALPGIWQSVAQLEAFPETYNHGYFVVRASVALLAALVLVQAILDLAGVVPTPDPAR